MSGGLWFTAQIFCYLIFCRLTKAVSYTHLAEDAEVWNAKGEKVVLVRLETSPEDITGMKASQGILTVRGLSLIHILLSTSLCCNCKALWYRKS